eukprot:7866886-Pyramimonas_sp.AAC.1
MRASTIDGSRAARLSILGGRDLITDLGCVIDLANAQAHVLATDLPNVQLVMSKSGHPAIRIDDWPFTGFPFARWLHLGHVRSSCAQGRYDKKQSSTSLSSRHHHEGCHHENHYQELQGLNQPPQGHRERNGQHQQACFSKRELNSNDMFDIGNSYRQCDKQTWQQ